MSIICKVDYATALKYKGLNLSTKYNNKKHKVYLKLIGDDFTITDSIALAKVSKNILMVEYQGLQSNSAYEELTENTGVYVGRVYDFGNNITEEDVEKIVGDTPKGVTPVIKLPDDYKDLYNIYQISKVFPTVRFCGGHLFAIEGVKVGAIGVDVLDKLQDKYPLDCYKLDGTEDVLEDVDITGLEIDTTSKPERAKKSSSGGSNKSAQKKSSKKVSIFDIFGL